MTPEGVITIGRQALEVFILVSAPMLITALITGLIVSIFQAATQINEMTLSFIPKLLVTFIVMIVFGSWMIGHLVDYTYLIFTGIPNLVG